MHIEVCAVITGRGGGGGGEFLCGKKPKKACTLFIIFWHLAKTVSMCTCVCVYVYMCVCECACVHVQIIK